MYILTCATVLSRSVVSPLFTTPRTVAGQAPLSMGILQARILDRTQVSRIAGGIFTIWATREAQPHPTTLVFSFMLQSLSPKDILPLRGKNTLRCSPQVSAPYSAFHERSCFTWNTSLLSNNIWLLNLNFFEHGSPCLVWHIQKGSKALAGSQV